MNIHYFIFEVAASRVKQIVRRGPFVDDQAAIRQVVFVQLEGDFGLGQAVADPASGQAAAQFVLGDFDADSRRSLRSRASPDAGRSALRTITSVPSAGRPPR